MFVFLPLVLHFVSQLPVRCVQKEDRGGWFVKRKQIVELQHVAKENYCQDFLPCCFGTCLPVRYQPAATLLLPNLQLKAWGASSAALCPDLTLFMTKLASTTFILSLIFFPHLLDKHPFVFSSHPLPLPSLDAAPSCECSAVKEDL